MNSTQEKNVFALSFNVSDEIVFNGMDITNIITNKISKASQMIITPVKVAAFLINLFAKANYP